MVSGVFPSTYHQGSTQKEEKKLLPRARFEPTWSNNPGLTQFKALLDKISGHDV